MQRYAPVPKAISEWSMAALEFETDEEAVATHLSEIAIKYCNVQASMSSRHDYSNSEYLVASLCAMDAEYTDLVNKFPVSFIYNTVALEPSEDAFSDYFHVYSSIWTATVWNHYRCVRILVNELILDLITYMLEHPEEYVSSWDKFSSYENQITTSRSTLLELSHDICSSVPFYLGYSANSIERHSRTPPKAVSGNMLLWPLFIAARTQVVSGALRDWVAGRLRMISEVMGIRQAALLEHILEPKQDVLKSQTKTDGLSNSPAVVD
jgi:hypothetical protein